MSIYLIYLIVILVIIELYILGWLGRMAIEEWMEKDDDDE